LVTKIYLQKYTNQNTATEVLLTVLMILCVLVPDFINAHLMGIETDQNP